MSPLSRHWFSGYQSDSGCASAMGDDRKQRQGGLRCAGLHRIDADAPVKAEKRVVTAAAVIAAEFIRGKLRVRRRFRRLEPGGIPDNQKPAFGVAGERERAEML